MPRGPIQGGVHPYRIVNRLPAGRNLLLLLALILFVTSSGRSLAAMQFDVFVGYGDSQAGVVRAGNWFPMGIEVHHDGPGFTGVIEVTAGSIGNSILRRTVVELPTNTRKRLTIPVYHGGGNYARWSIRLRNEKGRVLAEHEEIAPSNNAGWKGMIVGSLGRTYRGSPVLPKVASDWKSMQPVVARMQPSLFPDNPIALGGLSGLYLSSSQALNLSTPQVEALLSWLNGGGNLVVGIEQATDVSGTPWLAAILPCTVDGMTEGNPSQLVDYAIGRPSGTEDEYWKPVRKWKESEVAKIKADSKFREAGGFPIVKCVEKGSGEAGVIMTHAQGLGNVTALAFSPEREPVRSWTNREWFWASVFELPSYSMEDLPNSYYANNQSLDGVLGYLVDSRQVKKLPVEWLFLLLVGYLVVIGPLDYFILKKLNRQMLTWITFPTYVVLFSVLIYWIGFALRAGEIEWNEVHVVDVIGQGDKALKKGRTYGSVYSPANSRYEFRSTQRFAAIRGEFTIYGSSGLDSGTSSVTHAGDGFMGDIFVPVWTSQMFVTDWWESGAAPLVAEVRVEGNKITGSVRNLSDEKMEGVRVFVRNRFFDVGTLAPGEIHPLDLSLNGGSMTDQFLSTVTTEFSQAANQRGSAFGRMNYTLLKDAKDAVMAASLVNGNVERQLEEQGFNGHRNEFASERDAGVGHLLHKRRGAALERDRAIVMAWAEESRPTVAMHQFNPRRASVRTLYRVVAQGGSQ